MRKTLLLCLLCHSWLCQAQNTQLSIPVDRPLPYSRKAWLVGFQVGYSKNSAYGQERYSATQVYGGCFVANKLLVGLAATRGQESFKSLEDVTISAGPMVRYQFTRTRFSPFIVGAYQFGKATVSDINSKIATPYSQDRPIQSRYVGVGMSIRVVAACRLDLLLTWQDKPGAAELGINGKYNLLQAQIGVNYLINRKQ